MRTVDLRITIPNPDPDAVYRVLADFERYSEFSDAVRSVTVTGAGQDVTISLWEVNFRAGVMRWREEDIFDRPARRITFRQLEGDVALFDGSWHCVAIDGATEIAFSARLDMGVPSLADALEPIAVRTLVDNTLSILTGLFGSASLTSSEVGVPAVAGVRQ
jgi:uncharacterized membrane protein